MTDTADILFKELPRPASAESIRKKDRFDTESADRNLNVSEKSREKSFAEHLDEKNGAHETQPQNNKNKSVTDDKPAETEPDALTERSDTIASNKEPHQPNPDNDSLEPNHTAETVQASVIPVVVTDKTEKSTPFSRNSVVVENTGAAGKSDTPPAQESAPDTTTKVTDHSAASVKTEVPHNIVVSTTVDHAADNANIKDGADPKIVAQTNTTGTQSPSPEQQLSSAQTLTSDAKVSANGQTAAEVTGLTNSLTEKPVPQTPSESVAQTKPVDQGNANVEQAIVNTGGGPTNENTGGKAGNASQETVAQNLNNSDDGEVIQIASAVKPPQNDILEKANPTETVVIESTRIATVAPVQPQAQSQTAKNNSNIGKSNTKASGAKAESAQPAVSNQGQQSANNAQKTTLSNASKSDISIDVGTLAQKSEPAPLQPLNPNIQNGLPNSTLLAAQDINVQRLNITNPLLSVKPEAPVTSKMINEQITVAINRNIVNGQNNFSIRLHPAELGQVDIRLEFAADGKMNASMVVENERTLSMLQRDQGALEKALQDAGVNLTGKNMNFSLAKQSKENGHHDANGHGHSSGEGSLTEEIPAADVIQQASLGYSNQSVDISV